MHSSAREARAADVLLTLADCADSAQVVYYSIRDSFIYKYVQLGSLYPASSVAPAQRPRAAGGSRIGIGVADPQRQRHDRPRTDPRGSRRPGRVRTRRHTHETSSEPDTSTKRSDENTPSPHAHPPSRRRSRCADTIRGSRQARPVAARWPRSTHGQRTPTPLLATTT